MRFERTTIRLFAVTQSLNQMNLVAQQQIVVMQRNDVFFLQNMQILSFSAIGVHRISVYIAGNVVKWVKAPFYVNFDRKTMRSRLHDAYAVVQWGKAC